MLANIVVKAKDRGNSYRIGNPDRNNSGRSITIKEGGKKYSENNLHPKCWSKGNEGAQGKTTGNSSW